MRGDDRERRDVEEVEDAHRRVGAHLVRLDDVRRLTADCAGSIEYVQSDSVEFLRRWPREQPGSIDLLYLDSLDYFDPHASEAHALAEARAAMGALAPDCLVLFDDTHPAGPAMDGNPPPVRGKGARAVPYLITQGFELASLADGQALLVRGSRMSG